MSIDINVELGASGLPLVARWQQEIDSLGFPFKLSADYDPQKDSGFWPVDYQGEVTGFEFYGPEEGEEVDEIAEDEPATPSVSFCCSKPLEVASALVAAVALAKLSGGKIFDPQEGVYSSVDQCLTDAKELMQPKKKRWP